MLLSPPGSASALRSRLNSASDRGDTRCDKRRERRMGSCRNGSILSPVVRRPRVRRSAALIGFAMSLVLASTSLSRSQAPGDKGASDSEWEQCLKAATRACVLRQAARVAESIEDPRLRGESLASVAKAQLE